MKKSAPIGLAQFYLILVIFTIIAAIAGLALTTTLFALEWIDLSPSPVSPDFFGGVLELRLLYFARWGLLIITPSIALIFCGIGVVNSIRKDKTSQVTWLIVNLIIGLIAAFAVAFGTTMDLAVQAKLQSLMSAEARTNYEITIAAAGATGLAGLMALIGPVFFGWIFFSQHKAARAALNSVRMSDVMGKTIGDVSRSLRNEFSNIAGNSAYSDRLSPRDDINEAVADEQLQQEASLQQLSQRLEKLTKMYQTKRISAATFNKHRQVMINEYNAQVRDPSQRIVE